jgi:hypothetical protein
MDDGALHSIFSGFFLLPAFAPDPNLVKDN